MISWRSFVIHLYICILGSLISVKLQCKSSIFFLFAVAKINMSHVKLIFWDLGGQQELQSLWDKVLQCSLQQIQFRLLHVAVRSGIHVQYLAMGE